MDDQVDLPPPAALRFDIRTLLWVTAVIASSVATFLPYGLWVAGAVLLFWRVVFSFKRAWITSGYWVLLAFLMLLLLLALLLPAVQVVRGDSPHRYCINTLRQLALGLHNYHDVHGAFPGVSDSHSEPPLNHSWRTAILPYIEENRLYAMLKLDEPWDSQANAPFTAYQLDAFECSHIWGTFQPGMTSYYAVVDEETLWRPDEPRSLKDIPDGAANTVMLIEKSPTIPWAKPEDLSFDKAVDLLTSPIDPEADGAHVIDQGFFYKPTAVRFVAWADGHVSVLRGPIPESLARAILTADGGEVFDPDELSLYSGAKPRLDYGRCSGFAVFVLTALAPLPRLIARSLARTADTPPAF